MIGRLTGELAESHAVVTDPDEFVDMEALEKRGRNLQVVSLCPLRYGLGWRV